MPAFSALLAKIHRIRLIARTKPVRSPPAPKKTASDKITLKSFYAIFFPPP